MKHGLSCTNHLYFVCFGLWEGYFAIIIEADIVYKGIVFYNDERAIRALTFGLLHWQSGSGSIAEKPSLMSLSHRNKFSNLFGCIRCLLWSTRLYLLWHARVNIVKYHILLWILFLELKKVHLAHSKHKYHVRKVSFYSHKQALHILFL